MKRILDRVRSYPSQLLVAPTFLMTAGLYGWLLYWLMPVAVPTRLAADHLRWVFADRTLGEAVAPHSLNSVWLLLLEVARLFGLSGSQSDLVAWASGISSVVLAASISVLMAFAILQHREKREGSRIWKSQIVLILTFALLALTPAVLWTAVVPNGLVFGFLFVAILSFARRAGRASYGFSVVEGFAAGLTPAAWILSLALAAGAREKDTAFVSSRRLLRAVCFVVGLALHPLLKLALEGGGRSSISWLPVFDSIRAIRYEDLMAGPMVFLGPVGESATGHVAAIAFSVVVLILWFGFKPVRLVLLGLSFLLPFSIGQTKAWKLAHPGWNTVLEDWALNIERGLNRPTVVLVDRLTEESVLKFVSSLQLTSKRAGASKALKASKQSFVIPLSSRKVFDSESQSLVQSVYSDYSLQEARQASSLSEQEIQRQFKDSRDMFLKAYIIPNVLRGVPFFIGVEFVSLLESGQLQSEISHRYFMNGIRLSNVPADNPLRLFRENLKSGFVRSMLGYHEGQLSRAIEVRVYERYAIYHLAMAAEYNRTKAPTDWQKRAQSELYAALRKVPWLDEPYRIVCEEPERLAKSESELKGNDQQTAVEPLEVCKNLFRAKGVFGFGR
jgi:hypothetical protein